MDPVNATNIVVQLTSEQISGMMQDRFVGLMISMILIVVGGLCGTKIRNEIGKIMGIILALLGSIGTVGFTLELIKLSTQMI